MRMKLIARLWIAISLLITMLSIESTRADVIFDLGGGAPVGFTENTGVQSFPIYIGTNNDDSITGVEFFLQADSGVFVGVDDVTSVGTVSGPGMFGNATLLTGDFTVTNLGTGTPGARLNSGYNPPTAVPDVSAALSSRLFATINVDTDVLGLGTYNIADAGFVEVDGGAIAASVTSGSFTISAVPEPSGLGLVGLVGVVTALRRRRNA